MSAALRLITIGPSHYCEKARWALDRAGLPFEERSLPPGMHRGEVRKHGGRHSVPLLVTPDGPITDSTDILTWADARGASLWPPGEVGDEARRLEAWLDADLGPHVRRALYWEILPHWKFMRQAFGHGWKPMERMVITAFFPIIRIGMRKYMNIYEEPARRSRAAMHAVCDRVEAAIADGRPYLTGDQFTGADLAFAALLGPAVVPPEYGHPLPDPDVAPDGLRTLVEGIRARPAGQLALRLYREDRHRRPA